MNKSTKKTLLKRVALCVKFHVKQSSLLQLVSLYFRAHTLNYSCTHNIARNNCDMIVLTKGTIHGVEKMYQKNGSGRVKKTNSKHSSHSQH